MVLLSELKPNFCLKGVTTFGIGGKARFFAEARSIEELEQLFEYCQQQKLPSLLLGKGSNLLMDDRGFDGLVISVKIDSISTDGKGLWIVGAGYSFSLLGTRTAKEGWTGLEFASGIPGSLGGAIYMNAGANGGETCHSLIHVDYIHSNGKKQRFARADLQFGNRLSPFQHMQGAIISAAFQLQHSEEARDKQLALIQYRRKTQPYHEKSAGCAFCNPPGKHAGALIEQAGLKGMAVGDAAVSTLHANFIVNKGNATAQHVLELMALIQQRVYAVHGILLEPEIRFISS